MPSFTIKLIPIDGSLKTCKSIRVLAFSTPYRHFKLEMVLAVDETVRKDSSAAEFRDWVLDRAKVLLALKAGAVFEAMSKPGSVRSLLDLGDL